MTHAFILIWWLFYFFFVIFHLSSKYICHSVICCHLYIGTMHLYYYVVSGSVRILIRIILLDRDPQSKLMDPNPSYAVYYLHFKMQTYRDTIKV